MALNILAVETATEACSAALLCQGQISERYQWAPRCHTSLILPMLQSLLAEASIGLSQLDALAFSRGPGSFTGVRMAVSIAQASALALDIPVVPVSSLQALAQGVYRAYHYKQVLVALDARMGEVYWGAYQLEEDVLSACLSEKVGLPEQLDWPKGCTADPDVWVGAGSGWDTYHERLQRHLGKALLQWLPQCHPRAYDVVVIAQQDYQHARYVDAEQALAVYLRDNVVAGHGPVVS